MKDTKLFTCLFCGQQSEGPDDLDFMHCDVCRGTCEAALTVRPAGAEYFEQLETIAHELLKVSDEYYGADSRQSILVESLIRGIRQTEIYYESK